MKAVRNILVRYPLLIALITFIVVFFGILRLPDISADAEVNLLYIEFVGAAFLIILISIISGIKTFRFSLEGLGLSFKLNWWPLTLSLLVGIGPAILMFVAGNASIVPNAFTKVILVLLAYFCVGITEEALDRGVIFNALLDKMGKNFKGILGAVLLSSFIFGFSHVISAFFHGTVTDAIAWANVIGKTLQTGMMGFVWAVVYIRTKNFWMIAIPHALNDIFPSIPQAIIQSSSMAEAGAYVAGGESGNGLFNIIYYTILCLLTLPPVIIAYKELKKVHVPQEGFFVSEWYPGKSESEIH